MIFNSWRVSNSKSTNRASNRSRGRTMRVWGVDAANTVAWMTANVRFFSGQIPLDQPCATNLCQLHNLFLERSPKLRVKCSRMPQILALSAALHGPPRGDDEGVSIESRSAAYLPALIPLEDEDKIYKSHHFSERANWLVPGKVMLGQYPGQVPADFPSDTQQGRDRIRDVVLGGGVTDLLSLQAELPPQTDEHQWSRSENAEVNGLFFNGFRAYRDDALAAVAEAEEVRLVNAKHGGGGQNKLAFHHFPIPDLSPVEKTALLGQLVEDLESLVMSDKVVFIHCWAGRGRTGLVAACLLGRLYPELSAEQSLTRVDTYYRTRGTVAVVKSVRVSPETEEQVDQVRAFFEQILGQ
ncbi:unnamed protein product [Ascophyllum nodosum]